MTTFNYGQAITVTASIPSGYTGYNFLANHRLKVGSTVVASVNGVAAGNYTFSSGITHGDSGTLTHESMFTYTTVGGTVIPETDWVVSETTHSYVYDGPFVEAGPDQSVVRLGLVSFTSAGTISANPVASYTWTFTDDNGAQTLTGASPTYRFTMPGTIVVTLTVLDTLGYSGTDTVTITVTPDVYDKRAYVGKVGYTTIQNAIDGASAGQTVSLLAGETYVERPTVDKAVTLTYADGMDFKTNDDYITINQSLTADFTITATIRPELSGGTGNGYYNMYLGKATMPNFLAVIGGASGTLRQFEIEIGSGNRARWNIPDYVDVEKTYTVVRRSNIVYLYVDGTQITDLYSGSTTLTGTLELTRIGSGYASSYWYQGNIKNVQIWNRALSEDEINYNAGKILRGDEYGLVGYWPLIDGEGTTATDFAGSNNGTIVGATWNKEEPKYDVLSFDGVNDVVSVSNDSFNMTNSVTLSAWVYPRVLGSNGSMYSILEKHINTYSLWLINVNGTLEIRTWMKNIGSQHYVSSGANISLNSWQMITLVWDGNNISFYKDGVKITTYSATGTLPSSAEPIYIGAFSNSYWFNGLIKNCCIFKSALSDDDVLNLYNSNTTYNRNLADEMSVGPHGSSWTLQSYLYKGYKVYKNIVTSPNVINNFGFRSNSTALLNANGEKYITFRFLAKIIISPGVMSGYMRIRYTDETTSTHNFSYNPSNWSSSELGVWKLVTSTFALVQSKTPKQIDTFYMYRDNAPSGEIDYAGISIEQTQTPDLRWDTLVGFWPINEGLGSIVYDESGNGNNGAISGATWENEPTNNPIIDGSGVGDVITVSDDNANIKNLRVVNAGPNNSGVKFV